MANHSRQNRTVTNFSEIDMGSTSNRRHYHINSWSGRSIKKLREEHLKIQLTISSRSNYNLQEIVLFLTCAYTLLKMLLSKPYPILKGIIAKLSLRICFTGYK